MLPLPALWGRARSPVRKSSLVPAVRPVRRAQQERAVLVLQVAQLQQRAPQARPEVPVLVVPQPAGPRRAVVRQPVPVASDRS